VSELFPAALTTLAQETAVSATPAPGNGTRLQVKITGVPVGLDVKFIDFDNVAETPLAVALSTGVTNPQESTAPNSTLIITFDITGSDTSVAESITLDFGVGDTNGDLALGNSILNASVSLAPIADVAPYPIISFATNVEGSGTVATVNDCVTYLLFPWVTNFNVAGNPAAGAHFDTGLTFANTSADPFGPAGSLATTSGNALPQAGTCSMVMFANDGTVSGVVPTSVVPAGGTAVVDVANVFPGKSGYIFARCNFQGAHGFTYITDNWPMPPNTAVDYLGLIVPNPNLIPRNPAGCAISSGIDPEVICGTGEALAQ
jgi:hypothetical protein